MSGPNPHPLGYCGDQQCECPDVVRPTGSLSKSWLWTLALWSVFQFTEIHRWWDNPSGSILYQLGGLSFIAFGMSSLLTASLTIQAALRRWKRRRPAF